MLVGTHAEVLDRLTGVLGAAQEQRVGARGLLKRELVEREGLAAGGDDAGLGGGGEAQGGDGHLGHLEQAGVVGDGADHDDCLVLGALVQVGGDARERHGRPVDARGEQAAEDDLVEG